MKQVIHIINATGQKVAEGELDTETGVVTTVAAAQQDDVVRCEDETVMAAGTSDGARKAWESRRNHIVKLPMTATIYRHDPTSKYSFWDSESGKSIPYSRHEVVVADVPHKVESAEYTPGKRSVGSMSHPDMYQDVLPLAKKQHGAIGIGSMTMRSTADADEALGFNDKAKATDSAPVTETIHARAGYQVKASADEAAWKQGEETKFVFMPAGVHTITAGFRKGSINLTVKVDANSAKAAQASLESLRASRPKQKPYGCVEHREQEASVIAHSFEADEQGNVLLACEPTALGEQNVNGRIHWSWSPSFTTDAEYDKCKCGDCGLQTSRGSAGAKVCACAKPALYFPREARGSASNPARVTGVDFVLGTLTNRPAFHEMPPVRASEDAVQAGGTSEGAKKGWESREHRINNIIKLAFDKSEAADKSNKMQDHLDAAKLHKHAATLHTVFADTGATTEEVRHHRGAAAMHQELHEKHQKAFDDLDKDFRDSLRGGDSAPAPATIQATGTSDGARKGWQHRAAGLFEEHGWVGKKDVRSAAILASKRAESTNDKADHALAADLHKEAAVETRKKGMATHGTERSAKYHEDMVGYHSKEAAKAVEPRTAATILAAHRPAAKPLPKPGGASTILARVSQQAARLNQTK